MKKIKISEIVDAQAVADAAGVSRRTVTRAADSKGCRLNIAGKAYLLRRGIPAVFGKASKSGLPPSVQKMCNGGASSASIEPLSVLTRSEVAAELGCDGATVWRVSRKFGIGIDCYGETLLTREMLPALKNGIGKIAATADEVSEMKRQAVNVRWNRLRGAKSGKSGKATAGSRSRRSPAVSQ